MQIACDRKFQITQHIGTDMHKKKTQQFNKTRVAHQTLKQSFETGAMKSEQQLFNAELCEALLSANIPLQKLQNVTFRNFLQKRCNYNIPDESTLRKCYINDIYVNTIHSIKQKVKNNFIYFIVDETTDVCGRYIANLLVGTLGTSSPSKSYLIACKELERTNSSTILRFVNEVLMNFFLPEVVPTEKILLMLSDAATYMIKAGQQLKLLYPNLIHVTCLAHGLSRVAEEIRQQFPDVNSFINNVKKTFLKSPLRVQLYKEKMGGIPLPPEPIITRWGTWLDAAMFHAKHFGPLKELILDFDCEASVAIKKCQELLNKSTLCSQLAFIQNNYEFVSNAITSLETQGLSLSESVKVVEQFEKFINKAPGKISQIVAEKFRQVIKKNWGFSELLKVSKILNGDFQENVKFDPNIINCLKYAPITSVDVERSFSNYKNILSDRRQNFSVQNIEKHLIISYNKLND